MLGGCAMEEVKRSTKLFNKVLYAIVKSADNRGAAGC
jgi:hypothetical protein